MVHRTTKKLIDMNHEMLNEQADEEEKQKEEAWKKKVSSNYWMKKFLKNNYHDKLSFEVSIDMQRFRSVILYLLTHDAAI